MSKYSLMKIEIEFIKTFLNLLNLYLNLTSTNVKFPTLMICTLLTPRLHKIDMFLTFGKAMYQMAEVIPLLGY